MAHQITLPTETNDEGLRLRFNKGWQRLRNYPRFVQVLLGLYAAFYLTMGLFHGSHVLQHGFLARETALEVNIFYDALMLLGPLTAALLFFRPSVGMLVGLAITFLALYFSSYPEYTLKGGRPSHSAFHFFEGVFEVFELASMPIVWVGKMMYESTVDQIESR